MDSGNGGIDLSHLFSRENKYAKFYEYDKNRYAMVYAPHEPISPKTGLFLFNAGHRYRTGPHDIYVKIGVALSQRGIYVITPDPDGLGDGFRGFNYQNTQQHQNRIQKGLYVDDAITCLEFFKQELSLEKVVASGLCGGTRTALSCAVQWAGLDGIVAWSCPFQLSGNVRVGYRKEKAGNIGQSERTGLSLEKSAPKAVQPNKWLRLVLLQIDWSYHFTRLQRLLYKLCHKDMSFDYKAEKILRKLFKRNYPLVFIYSENDLHYEVFRDYYLPWFGHKYHVDLITTVLKKTNHVVGDSASQEKLYNTMYSFCVNRI